MRKIPNCAELIIPLKFNIFIIIFFIQQNIFSQDTNKDIHKDTLIMGVVNAVDSTMYKEYYTPFIQYIAGKLNMKPKLKVLAYDKIADELHSNKIDIGVFSPFSYIVAKNKYPELNLFAVPKSHGRMYYSPCIVARKDSPFNSIDDSLFIISKFAFIHKNSTSGYQIPQGFLVSKGIELKNIQFAGGHHKAIELLRDGKVDAIATYIEAFKEVGEDTSNYKILKILGKIPNNAYVFSPKLSDTLKKEIAKIMYNAHKDIDIDKRIIFKNAYGVESWIKKDDDFYNDLRYMLSSRRPKHKLIFKINTTNNFNKINKNDDLISAIKSIIQKKLVSSNRFAKEDEGFNKIDTLNLQIGVIKDSIYNIVIEINNKLIDLDKNTYNNEELINKLPKDIFEKFMSFININAKPIYDNKSKSWILPYGKNDGLNTQDYNIVLKDSKGKIIKNNINYKLTEDLINLSNIKREDIKENDFCEIQYKIKKRNGEISDNKKKGFWDYLDNVWGVIGLLISFFSILLSFLYQRYKSRKFNKMLTQANHLLKEYFEGKEISNKLYEFRASIGDFFQKNEIKETQYEILLKKIDEIERIINNYNKLNPEIIREIDKIIADGRITEKEYQYLIYLLNKNDR